MSAHDRKLVSALVSGCATGALLATCLLTTLSSGSVEAAGPADVSVLEAMYARLDQDAPVIRAQSLRLPLKALPTLDVERVAWGRRAAYDLVARRLRLPVDGFSKRRLSDSFLEARDEGRTHYAIDMAAPRGSPVVAVEDGVIQRIKWHKRGGLTVYLYDSTGSYSYYYAHMSRLAKGLEEGCHLQRGDVLGYVGTTGNAPSPHLHFAVKQLDDRESWWGGTTLNPYPVLMAGEARRPQEYQWEMAAD